MVLNQLLSKVPGRFLLLNQEPLPNSLDLIFDILETLLSCFIWCYSLLVLFLPTWLFLRMLSNLLILHASEVLKCLQVLSFPLLHWLSLSESQPLLSDQWVNRHNTQPQRHWGGGGVVSPNSEEKGRGQAVLSRQKITSYVSHFYSPSSLAGNFPSDRYRV